MPNPDVELVLRALRAAAARPKPDFATMNQLFHPEHVLIGLQTLDTGEFVGAREWQAGLREVAHPGHAVPTEGAPLSWEADIEAAVDVGAGKVLAVGSTSFRGASSGAEVMQRFWAVSTVRAGLVTRTETFTDPALALHAALPDE